MRSTSATILASLGLVLAGCGVFSSDGYGSDAPPPQGGEAAPKPEAPPLEGTPAEDELTEKFGLFVAVSGSSDGEGTRTKPLSSVSQAIAKGKEIGKRVYVCQGTYREVVTLERAVPVVGGLDCSTWKASGQRSRIEAPSSPAMIAKGIDVRTRVEGFEVVAPDGKPGAVSSIALHAETSPGLVLARTKLVAGKAADGAAGSNGIQLTLGAAANGGSSRAEVSGQPILFLQPPRHRSGENGGAGACIGEANHDGEPGGVGGKGGTYTCQSTYHPLLGNTYQWATYSGLSTTVGEVKTGAAGGAGVDGESASAIGSLSANGYAPAKGTAGTNGTPGKGGSGGGGGSMSSVFCSSSEQGYGATGPGGGAGGCPGLAGTPGEGGGASIGALLIASGGLTFDATEIEAKDGGSGGKGSFGSIATEGGAAGIASGKASAAGAGGAGGKSGVSGSGAGGPSFGVAYTEGAPVFANGSRAKAGKAGSGVAAETITDARGDVKTLAASADGIAKDDYTF